MIHVAALVLSGGGGGGGRESIQLCLPSWLDTDFVIKQVVVEVDEGDEAGSATEADVEEVVVASEAAVVTAAEVQNCLKNFESLKSASSERSSLPASLSSTIVQTPKSTRF